MYTCCRVLDANAFEIPLMNDAGVSFRGLFPMASIMNHSCSPNTAHNFGNSHQMTITASNTILVGEEITTTYVTLLLGTPARRNFLAKSKHFHCRCPRCKDPTVRLHSTLPNCSFSTQKLWNSPFLSTVILVCTLYETLGMIFQHSSFSVFFSWIEIKFLMLALRRYIILSRQASLFISLACLSSFHSLYP
jgi:hypothetical protein